MDMAISARAVSVLLLAAAALAACSTGSEHNPRPGDRSASASSEDQAHTTNPLQGLASQAGQQANDVSPGLVIVNERADRVTLTSADGQRTIVVEAGSSVRLVSQRSCALLPMTATDASGAVVGQYSGPCRGQTWTVSRFLSASQCAVMAPGELPNGTDATYPRPFREEGGNGDFMNSWGRGAGRVVIGRGIEALEWSGADSRRFRRSGGVPIVGGDGVTRWVLAVGDPPGGEITYTFVVGECPYVMWTAPGLSWKDALAYAGRVVTTAQP